MKIEKQMPMAVAESMGKDLRKGMLQSDGSILIEKSTY
jgi:hypothetical protein